MDNKIKEYIELINIKTINGYTKNIIAFLLQISLFSLIYLGLPSDILKEYLTYIDVASITVPSVISTIMIINSKRKRIKRYKLEYPNIDTNIPVKEMYMALKDAKVVKNNTPTTGIQPYFINIDAYYTKNYVNKQKRLVRKK